MLGIRAVNTADTAPDYKELIVQVEGNRKYTKQNQPRKAHMVKNVKNKIK